MAMYISNKLLYCQFTVTAGYNTNPTRLIPYTLAGKET